MSDVEGSFTQLQTRCAALRSAHQYEEEVALLASYTGVASLSRGDQALFLHLRGEAYRRTHRPNLALHCYEDGHALLIERANRLRVHLLCGLGSVYSSLACYEEAVHSYSRAHDDALTIPDGGELASRVSTHLAKAHLLVVRSEPRAPPSTLCHRCHKSCAPLVTCPECACVWYCGRRCQERDVAHRRLSRHHARFPLDELPTDVLHNILMPMLLQPASSPVLERHRIARQFGLGLRTFGRRWRTAVDGCQRFWHHVVPYHWPQPFKPFADAAPFGCRDVLALAREWQDSLLVMKERRVRSCIKEMDRALEKYRGKVVQCTNSRQGYVGQLAAIEGMRKRLREEEK